MDEIYYQAYSASYSSKDMPINPKITITDVVIASILGVLMLTIMTLLLNKWLKEEIKKMEDEWRQQLYK